MEFEVNLSRQVCSTKLVLELRLRKCPNLGILSQFGNLVSTLNHLSQACCSLTVFNSPLLLGIYIYLYLSIYPSMCIYTSMYIYLSIKSIHPSIYPSIHLSIYPSIHLYIYTSIQSIHLYIYLSMLG